MRAASARFAAAINKSHDLAVDAFVVNTATGVQTPLDVLEGSTVTIDGTAEIRARADLNLNPDDLPFDATDPLAPFGNEIWLARGITYSDGTRETVPLGRFRIDGDDISDAGDSFTLQVPCLDRSAIIMDAVFEVPYEVPASITFNAAIAAIITDAWPAVQMNFATTIYVTPNGITAPTITAREGEDKWDFCRGLGEAMKCDLYFDRVGVLQLAPVPLGTSLAVAEIAEGEQGLLLSASRNWSRDDAVNRVVVTGNTFRGVAIDDNDLSPTRYGGPFGKKTYEYTPSSPAEDLLTSDAHAASMARTILTTKLGIAQQVSFSALVDPRFDPYDVIRVRRLRLGVNQDSILDSLTIPLDPGGTMDGSVRASQVLA